MDYIRKDARVHASKIVKQFQFARINFQPSISMWNEPMNVRSGLIEDFVGDKSEPSEMDSKYENANKAAKGRSDSVFILSRT